MSRQWEASKKPLDSFVNFSHFISPKCLNSCLWTSHRVNGRVMKLLSLLNSLATSANSCSLLSGDTQICVGKSSEMPTCPFRQLPDFAQWAFLLFIKWRLLQGHMGVLLVELSHPSILPLTVVWDSWRSSLHIVCFPWRGSHLPFRWRTSRGIMANGGLVAADLRFRSSDGSYAGRWESHLTVHDRWGSHLTSHERWRSHLGTLGKLFSSFLDIGEVVSTNWSSIHAMNICWWWNLIFVNLVWVQCSWF